MIRVPNLPEQSGLRVRRLSLTPELLLAWFMNMREPRTFSQNGLPEDTTLVGCSYDADLGLIRLYLTSEAFGARHPGCAVEEIELFFTEHREEVALHR